MRLLTRYVLAELLKVFIVALTALTTVMLVFGLGKYAYDNGLQPAQIAQLIPYFLPDMLRYTIPATCLFAVSSVYGRMSGANEVVAIKSLGISPMAILWPGYFLAFVLSVLTFWLNDIAVTWGQGGAQRVVLEAVEEIVYGILRTQRSYATRNFSINVKGVEGRKLIQPTFSFMATGDSPPFTVMAEEAELKSEPERNVLKIVCRNCDIDGGGQASAKLDSFEHEISLRDASRSGDNSRLPARLAMREIPKEMTHIRQSLDEVESRKAMEVAVPLITGDYESLVNRNWTHDSLVIQDLRNHLYRLATESPRRLSNGFSCLCFVLIGAPMAIWRRNADFLTSFFLCFAPILAIYYPLLVFGVEQAKSGTMHPYIVWLGNVVLALFGYLILRRVIRY